MNGFHQQQNPKLIFGRSLEHLCGFDNLLLNFSLVQSYGNYVILCIDLTNSEYCRFLFHYDLTITAKYIHLKFSLQSLKKVNSTQLFDSSLIQIAPSVDLDKTQTELTCISASNNYKHERYNLNLRRIFCWISLCRTK